MKTNKIGGKDMHCDILVTNVTVLNDDFEFAQDIAVVVNDTHIIEIGSSDELEKKYTAKETINGKNKLLMPGFVDAHTHTCQQFLRGRTSDEFPMIWTRFLVPFESNLSKEDVRVSAQAACLEMITSGTTAFADSGGMHMEQVAKTVIESGMRGAIATSTMDSGPNIPDSMKMSAEDNVKLVEELIQEFHNKGDERIQIWFAMRQVMTCSPNMVQVIAQKAKEYNTGVHAHLAEHKDEVSYCLVNYKKRPAEYLDDCGLLGPNLLTAHNVVLSESELTLMQKKGVKVIHCPRANLANHGFSKTPRMVEMGMDIGLGTDGAASSALSLFEEMQVFRYGMRAFWGLPIFDPLVLPVKKIVQMATIGGATALGLESKIGSIKVGKKADFILVDIHTPSNYPTHNLLSSLVEATTNRDVIDSVINGKVVMKNREVLTLDKEKILFESKKASDAIANKAGIF